MLLNKLFYYYIKLLFFKIKYKLNYIHYFYTEYYTEVWAKERSKLVESADLSAPAGSWIRTVIIEIDQNDCIINSKEQLCFKSFVLV